MWHGLYDKASPSPKGKADILAARAAYVAAQGKLAYASAWPGVHDDIGTQDPCPVMLAKAKHCARLAARLYKAARTLPHVKRLAVLFTDDGEIVDSGMAFGPYHAAALFDQTAFHVLRGNGNGVAAWADRDSDPSDGADMDIAYYQEKTDNWLVTSVDGYHG